MIKDKVTRIIIKLLRRFKFTKQFATPDFVEQFMRYIITGFSSAAIEFTLLFILRDTAKLSILAANTIALSIVFWFNFLMNRFWSFKSTGDIKKQLVMYLILFLFNLAASDFMMYFMTDKLSIQYLIAKVIAIGVVVCWNFIIYRKVIYK
jgi:putative flippase GtrA